MKVTRLFFSCFFGLGVLFSGIVYAQNDPDFNLQWDKLRIGCPAAWNTNVGTSSPCTIAIVGTGIRDTHEDLAANMWIGNDTDTLNPASHGRYYTDALTFTNNIADEATGIGTHMAGIAAAVGNNAKGIAGVIWTTKIMAIKVCTTTIISNPSTAQADTIAAGINYAVTTTHGLPGNPAAQVLLLGFSLRGTVSSTVIATIRTALENARSLGVVIVVPAGNDAKSLSSLYYPGAFTMTSTIADSVIAVGASNAWDAKSTAPNATTSTNYSKSYVELFAPGEDIYTTTNTSDTSYGLMDNQYSSFAAAAQVTGGVSLIRSYYVTLSSATIRTFIGKNADKKSQTLTDCINGMFNVGAAIVEPTVAASFGTNQGGLQAYRYSYDMPGRSHVVAPRHFPHQPMPTDPSQLLPTFSAPLLEEEVPEGNIVEAIEEPAPDASVAGDSRTLGWTQISSTTSASTITMEDIDGDYYPELLYGKSAVYAYNFVAGTTTSLGVPVQTFTKIMPIDWYLDQDTTTPIDPDQGHTVNGYKNVVLVGKSGLYLWRKYPTTKLTTIYSGKILDAAFIDTTYTDINTVSYLAKQIIFSVENKGVFRYVRKQDSTNALNPTYTGVVIQMHTVPANLLTSYEVSAAKFSVVASFPGFGIYYYTIPANNNLNPGTWSYIDLNVPMTMCVYTNTAGGTQIIAAYPLSGDAGGTWGWRNPFSGTPLVLSVDPSPADFLSVTDFNYNNDDELIYGFKTGVVGIYQSVFQDLGGGNYQWQGANIDSRSIEGLGTWLPPLPPVASKIVEEDYKNKK